MTTPHYILLLIFTSAVSAGIAFAVGQWRGRALGWLEHYTETERQKRERRDRRGRFIAIKAKAKGTA